MLCCDSGVSKSRTSSIMFNTWVCRCPAPGLLGKRSFARPAFARAGFFESLKHQPESGIGERRTIGRPWKLSGTDLAITRPAPQLGEHNRELLTTLLECSDAEVDAMEKSQVIGNTIAGSPVIAALHLDGMRKNSRIGKMDDEYREV